MSLRNTCLAQAEQPSRGVLRKRCSENMQQIYRRTPMPNCDFKKVALYNDLLNFSFCEYISS